MRANTNYSNNQLVSKELLAHVEDLEIDILYRNCVDFI